MPLDIPPHFYPAEKILSHPRSSPLSTFLYLQNRVKYITYPPSAEQSKQAANRGWLWHEWDVDLNAWTNLECGPLGGAAESSASLGTQGRRQLGQHAGAAEGAKGTGSLWQFLLQGAAGSSRSRSQEAMGRKLGVDAGPGGGGGAAGPAGPATPRVTEGFPELRCTKAAQGKEPLPAFPIEAYGEGGRMIERGFLLFKNLYEQLKFAHKDAPEKP